MAKTRCIITGLGGRIKTLRQQKQLTLAELAEMSNLSASHLSQIEQDKKMPSLVALTSIAEVLEVNPRYLLETEESQVFITRANLTATVNSVPSITSMELTSAVSGSELQVHRLILQPRAHPLKFEPHPGEALGFVLEGKLLIVFEGQQIEFESGDSIHFDANQVYRLQVQGEIPCILIWCNSPPQSDIARKISAVLGDGAADPVP